MQSVTYHLDTSDIDNRLIDSIRSMFANGRVTVTVTPEGKEITNPELLARIEENRASGISYLFEGDEFDTVAQQLLTGESVDPTPYRREKQ